MTQWEVFLAFVAILGFCITIFKISSYFNRLDSTIATLNGSITVLNKAVEEIAKKNTDSHKRLWDHNEEQDKLISDHEKRIGILERLEE